MARDHDHRNDEALDAQTSGARRIGDLGREARVLCSLRRPAGDRDCADFATQDQAQEYFDTLSIPKLNESSPLVGLGLNADKSIQVPPLSQPMQAGVYTKGPMPGQVGPAVVLAHINTNGQPGFGAGLHTLAAGDKIDVTTPTGPVTYAVTRTDTVPKSEFPTAAVYSDTKDPELRLITCGGTLDRSAHNYLGQTVVYATKV